MANLGLIGWWRLDETDGTTAADSSGNGLNGRSPAHRWAHRPAAGYSQVSILGTENRGGVG
jgi:hypothetical protein